MPKNSAFQAYNDAKWMALALDEAKAAGSAGEVPVGAVVVKDGVLISSGRNGPISTNDPTAHAEIAALRHAGVALSNYRLNGCTLYVTLEPCAMCAGAILHARVDRVVFGAIDAKTGAAGSVLNLFSQTEINHHTNVLGGVLAGESSALLGGFFKRRRQQSKAESEPLREDALRTPDRCFEVLPLSLFKSHYFSDSPTLGGLRMHYLDEGPRSSENILLCMHGNSGWGIEFWAQIGNWVSAGKRVIVPDLIGFGKSDKFKRQSAHSLEFHIKCLIELLGHLHIKHAILVAASSDSNLGNVAAEFEAPYPDKGHESALIAFKLAGFSTAEIAKSALEHLAST